MREIRPYASGSALCKIVCASCEMWIGITCMEISQRFTLIAKPDVGSGHLAVIGA